MVLGLERVDKPVETEDFKLPVHNWEALRLLEQAVDHLSNEALMAGGSAIATGSFVNPAGFLLFAAAYKPLIRVQKLARIKTVFSLLLEHFGDQEVQVFPIIQIDGKNPIDLYVRFPKKTQLFISIRSKGDNKIAYNQAKEVLQVRKKRGGGTSIWEPCPLVELGDYKSWLDKNRGLFGLSSKEAQKTPTAKVLVLWHPTKAQDHTDSLYSEVGDMKLLAISRKGTAFVIQEEEILNFVKSWLSKYQ